MNEAEIQETFKLIWIAYSGHTTPTVLFTTGCSICGQPDAPLRYYGYYDYALHGEMTLCYACYSLVVAAQPEYFKKTDQLYWLLVLFVSLKSSLNEYNRSKLTQALQTRDPKERTN